MYFSGIWVGLYGHNGHLQEQSEDDTEQKTADAEEQEGVSLVHLCKGYSLDYTLLELKEEC